jgi:DNA ligase-1
MYDDILEYWIFDIADETLTYKNRIDKLKEIKMWYENKYTVSSRCINFEFYEEIDDFSLIQNYHDKYVTEGYEGLIVRNLDGMYKFKYRTNDLQKYKNFEDSEFKIVGFKSGRGTEKGAIIYICETKNGITFDVRPRGSIDDRIDKYNRGNDYIGKQLIVRYQPAIKTEDQEKDELPRFPVGIEIRDYE